MMKDYYIVIKQVLKEREKEISKKNLIERNKEMHKETNE